MGILFQHKGSVVTAIDLLVQWQMHLCKAATVHHAQLIRQSTLNFFYLGHLSRHLGVYGQLQLRALQLHRITSRVRNVYHQTQHIALVHTPFNIGNLGRMSYCSHEQHTDRQGQQK